MSISSDSLIECTFFNCEKDELEDDWFGDICYYCGEGYCHRHRKFICRYMPCGQLCCIKCLWDKLKEKELKLVFNKKNKNNK